MVKSSVTKWHLFTKFFTMVAYRMVQTILFKRHLATLATASPFCLTNICLSSQLYLCISNDGLNRKLKVLYSSHQSNDLNNGTFDKRTILDSSNTQLVRSSDPLYYSTFPCACFSPNIILFSITKSSLFSARPTPLATPAQVNTLIPQYRPGFLFN